MLNAENRKIYRSLKGEYKKFAKRLCSAIRVHCRGREETDDALSGMFGILSEAQAQNRPLAEVIPDAGRTISDTVACLPLKRAPHAVLLCSLVLIASLVAAGVTFIVSNVMPKPAKPLSGIIYSLSNGALFWYDEYGANCYDVYIDNVYVGQSDIKKFDIELDEGVYDVRIVSYGRGNDLPSENSSTITVEYPCAVGDISSFIIAEGQTGYGDNGDYDPFAGSAFDPFLDIDIGRCQGVSSFCQRVVYSGKVGFYGKIAVSDGAVLVGVAKRYGNNEVPVGDYADGLYFSSDVQYSFTVRGENAHIYIGIADFAEFTGRYVDEFGAGIFHIDRGNPALNEGAVYTSDDTTAVFAARDREMLFSGSTVSASEYAAYANFCPALSGTDYVLVTKVNGVYPGLHIVEGDKSFAAEHRGSLTVEAGYTQLDFSGLPASDSGNFVMYGKEAGGATYVDDAFAAAYFDADGKERGITFYNEYLVGGRYESGGHAVIFSAEKREVCFSAVRREAEYDEGLNLIIRDWAEALGNTIVLKPGITSLQLAVHIHTETGETDCDVVSITSPDGAFICVGDCRRLNDRNVVCCGNVYIVNASSDEITLNFKWLSAAGVSGDGLS